MTTELRRHPILWSLLAVYVARALWLRATGEWDWLLLAVMVAWVALMVLVATGVVEWWQGRAA